MVPVLKYATGVSLIKVWLYVGWAIAAIAGVWLGLTTGSPGLMALVPLILGGPHQVLCAIGVAVLEASASVQRMEDKAEQSMVYQARADRRAGGAGTAAKSA